MTNITSAAEFESAFRGLLPRSFDFVFPYVRAHFGQGPKLTKHRSPSQRHTLVVTKLIFPPDFPRLNQRLTEANRQYLKTEFVAALGVPFDHLADDDVSAKLRLFLSDCEVMPDEPFETLLGCLTPSLWEHPRWWFMHSAPRLILLLFEVAIGTLFLLQKIFGLRIVGGSFSTTSFGPPLILNGFETVIIGLSIAALLLAIVTNQLTRLVAHVLVVAFLPLVAIVYIARLFFRRISTLPYETLDLASSFRVRNPFADIRSFIVACALECFALINICVFRGTIWAQFNIFLATVSLLVLVFWFYFWNFQPLVFLETGIRVFVRVSKLGIPIREQTLATDQLSAEQIIEVLNKLRRLEMYLDRMAQMVITNRFDIFAANCFILLLLTFLFLVVVDYSVICWGLFIHQPGLFRPVDGSAVALTFRDFVILSLNNLPIGGTPNLRGTTLAMECLLFSERFLAASLLVIAVFAYSVVSSEQIRAGKERLREMLFSYRDDVHGRIQAVEEAPLTRSSEAND